MTLITPENFDKSLEIIRQADEVAIDTETYWMASWNKPIIGVSVFGEVQGKFFSGYYPYRHEWDDAPNLLLDSLELLTKTLNEVPLHSMHNAKFDRARFHCEGLYLTSPFFCTMVASHMVNENGSHELEDLAEHYHIDPVANKRKQYIHEVRQQIMWHKIPPEIMVPYACGDTRNTYYLKRRLILQLEHQELMGLWPTEEIYSDALMHMEINGFEIDPVLADDLAVQCAKRMAAIRRDLGLDPAKPLPLATLLFKKLGLPIYEIGKPSKQFPMGRPKMGEPILEKLSKVATGEARAVMDLVLEYRGLQKAKSTWYEGWPSFMDSENRIHPKFSQHGTVTTRLSCSKPNVQQIPRQSSDELDKRVKRLVKTPKGTQLWELDYSQIEYRLAGVLSNDPVILEAYRQGKDMHASTGEKLGQIRQDAKATNFLFIYEGGPTCWADKFNKALEEAKIVHSGYHSLYHVMFRFASRVNAAASQRGYIKLWDGRRRHFKFSFETKKAWASYVQGGAAIIAKQGICRLHQDKDLMKHVKLVNAVHDSIWLELPEDLAESLIPRAKAHLEWPSNDPRFLIPFPVETKRLA